MTDLMDSPLLAPLADLLTPDKVETLQEMARVFYSNRSDISSVARHSFALPHDKLLACASFILLANQTSDHLLCGVFTFSL